MKYYREYGVNPFASCLPLLIQLPVLISLFYMLRTDLKQKICGVQAAAAYPSLSSTQLTTFLRQARLLADRRRAQLGELPLHPRHHAEGNGRHADRADRPVPGDDADDLVLLDDAGRAHPADHVHGPAARLHGDHHPVPGGPVAVLDDLEHDADPAAVVRAPPRASGDAGKRAAANGRAAPADARRAAAATKPPRSAPPPQAPRKRKKRSGRRRYAREWRQTTPS